MAAEETPQQGIRTHRPLPSIDIPILRGDRRASRARRLVTTTAVVVALSGGAAAAFVVPALLGGRPDRRPQPGEPAVPVTLGARDQAPDAGLTPPIIAPVVELAAPNLDGGPAPLDDVTPTTPGASTRRTVAFGRAGGFQPALLASGSSRAESQELIDALTHVLDFRHCRPEDQLTYERDEVGKLVRFEYRADRTHIYEAVRGRAGTLVGRQVEVPVQHVRVTKGGYVAGALGDALEHNGLGRALIGVFVDTFSAVVNFGTQTRSGDSFRVIVDEERIDGEFLRYGKIFAIEYTGERSGRHQAFFFNPTSPPRDGEGDFFDDTGRTMHGGWLRTPVAYDRISSPFDLRRMHPLLHRIMPHNGIDYAASSGTPVWAAAEGTVIWAGDRGANGNLVGIRHADGFESYYAHLSRIERGIRVGAEVRQRQAIGAVGTTGRSTGPHLHFGLKRRGAFVDPARHLNGPGRMMASASLPAFRRLARELSAELARIPLAPAPAPSGVPAPPTGDTFGDEEELDLPPPPRRH